MDECMDMLRRMNGWKNIWMDEFVMDRRDGLMKLLMDE